MRPRGRHLAPSLRRINRSWALPLALAFSIFLTSVALADNLEADGDALATGFNTLAFGPVCPGSEVTKDVSLLIRALGHPGSGTNNFANGSSVGVTRGTISSPALAAAASVGAIILPSDWLSKQNGVLSAAVTQSVTLTAPANPGSESLALNETIAYSASGPRSSNPSETVTRSTSLAVSATVLPSTHSSCATTSPNNPPVAEAGGPYSGDEGSAIALDGTGSSDIDGDSLTYSWSVDSPLCSFDDATAVTPDVTCTDNGAFTVTLTVEDGDGESDSDSAPLTVANVAPSITLVAFVDASASCGTDNASLGFGYTDPGSNDTQIVTVDWGDGSVVENVTASSAMHTYATAGMYTATLTVTDDDGGADTDAASVTVNYTIVGGGVLPPIKADGTSVFKYGSTVPVKIKVQDCDGSTPGNLAPRIQYQKISGTTPGGLVDPLSTSAADTTGVMRFTGAPDFQYIYNLATRSLPDATATYKAVITIPATGQVVSSANWGVK